MQRDEVLHILREHREELRRRFGVSRLALFGSVARNEATEASDVDLLVEFNRPIGLFHLSRTRQFLERMLDIHKVDLVTPDGIRPAIREVIFKEVIDA